MQSLSRMLSLSSHSLMQAEQQLFSLSSSFWLTNSFCKLCAVYDTAKWVQFTLLSVMHRQCSLIGQPLCVCVWIKSIFNNVSMQQILIFMLHWMLSTKIPFSLCFCVGSFKSVSGISETVLCFIGAGIMASFLFSSWCVLKLLWGKMLEVLLC